ncbi:MAG TPA: hypothetical protein VHC48_02055 [Puia sp.]|jgi:hypothetical protein|nr:hypothetical protein [Puia sp.]
MNFDFAEQINFALEKLDMKEVIEIAETKLGQLPETEYHEVIGRSLVGQADETIFVIEGYWCEQVIIARFMELMRAAHMSAKEKRMTWADVPVYFTEHAYDFIVRSEVN